MKVAGKSSELASKPKKVAGKSSKPAGIYSKVAGKSTSARKTADSRGAFFSFFPEVGKVL